MTRLRRFFSNSDASSLVEFALTLPIFLLLFLGAIELTRYIIILQKIDKTAYTIADIITRTEAATENPPQAGSLTVTELQVALDTFENLMAPFPIDTRGTVIVTSFQKPDAATDPLIRWQAAEGILGSAVMSEISSSTPASTAPALRNVTAQFSPEIAAILSQTGGMNIRENLIAVEVFYRFNTLTSTSFFGDDIDGTLLKRNAFFNPRFGSLVNLPPVFTGE